MLQQIEQLHEQGHWQAALDSIRLLRDRYPKALPQRQRALEIWQEASLLLTQRDIALTDSALQAVTLQASRATTPLQRNRLNWKRDSLRIRYETLCGTVRIIRKKQNEQK